jgi:hypothetical protein
MLFKIRCIGLGMAILPAGAGISGYPTRRAWYGQQNPPAGAGMGIKIRPRAANGLESLPAGIPATCIKIKKAYMYYGPTH